MSSAILSAPQRESAHLDRALISAFLENSPHYIYFKDHESRFLVVSRSLIRYLGRQSAAEVLGRTDSDFFSLTHARAAHEDEERIRRTGQPLIGKLERATWPDGRVSWVITNKLPLRNGQGEIIGTCGMSRDVTKAREVELALEKAHKDLVDASRMAGMAEVATGVLHNVGNVLSSLNVSASIIGTGLRQSKADSLARLATLLREHESDLAHFLTHDPKGRRVPEFLASLASLAVEERARLKQEVALLQKNVDHIKEIVSMQQTYATLVGVLEPLDPVTLMEDAMRMNAGALVRTHVQVARDFALTPPVLGEKAKVLQILVNLIRNAKNACDESGADAKRVVLRIQHIDTGGNTASMFGSVAPYGMVLRGRVRFVVEDNGVGIPPENLTRIFGHGFTTRANGHGFGLHSSANAAREMKGSLFVHSDGPGRGATFTLDLPAAAPAGSLP